MKKYIKKAKRLTPTMLVSRYSGERLEPNATNFPALRHLWDMNNIDGAFLRDTVGTQHIEADPSHYYWALDDRGFAKGNLNGVQYAPQNFEAPNNRDFILVGCGQIAWTTRAISIGGQVGDSAPPYTAGVSWDITRPPSTPSTPSAFRDGDNYCGSVDFSFSPDLSTTDWTTGADGFGQPGVTDPGIIGCFATVIRPSTGVCDMHWAGRISSTAPYDPIYEVQALSSLVGTIQGTYGEIGSGWTTFPANRFEWVALLYFENGAPNDIEEAVRWMAQYNDIRLYPGWSLIK